ncbi:MAG: exodeoxyribonuclease VII small subunit [Clostridia bacterium]|nr:exodeoxyribonuclease VII small subunit [Clostridia bacterium]
MSSELTFETAMQRLEEIVTLLENGKCSLDESMKLFDEGTKLATFCSGTLKEAEQKILQLTADDAAQTEA